MRHAAHVVKRGKGEAAFDGVLVFGAGDKHGALRQDRAAGRDSSADAVEFVAADGACAARAEHQ